MTTPTAQAGLPELPEPFYFASMAYDGHVNHTPYHTADQMHGYALAAVRAAQAAQPAPDPNEVHSCSLYCYLPACIKAQRDEMRDILEAQATQPERKPLSDAEAWAAIDAIYCYRGDYSMAVFRAAEKVHGIGDPK